MAKQIHIDMDLARQMRKEGKSWDDIGEALGVTGETVHKKLDPEYADSRRHGVNLARAGEPRTKQRRAGGDDPTNELALARVAPDTRTWQQRLMGDPPANRSALAMRKQTA